MSDRLKLLLFGLLLVALPVAFAKDLITPIIRSFQVSDWKKVQGQILATADELDDFGRGDIDGSVKYSYSFDNTSYTGQRAYAMYMSRVVGGETKILARKLLKAKARDETIPVYLNPTAPEQSVLVPETSPWVYFLILDLCALMLILPARTFYAVIVWNRRPHIKVPEGTQAPSPNFEPWRLNALWQKNPLSFHFENLSRSSGVGSIFFALIGLPIASVMFNLHLVRYSPPHGFISAGITVLCLLLLAQAIKKLIYSRRWKNTRIYLNPFPGVLGSHVGGWIDLTQKHQTEHEYEIALTHTRCSIEASTEGTSLRETPLWQDRIKTHGEPRAKVTRLPFFFELPADLGHESDPFEDTETYYIWTLKLSANHPGCELEALCRIPVFDTKVPLNAAQNAQRATTQSKKEEDEKESLASEFEIRERPWGPSIYYPAGQPFFAIFIVVCMSLFFLGFGSVLWLQGLWVRSIVPALVGTILLYRVLFASLSSLEIHRENHALISTLRLLGLTIKRKELPLNSLLRIQKDSRASRMSNDGGILYFSLFAEDPNGTRVKLSNMFIGEAQADAAIARYCELFDLDEAIYQRSVSSDSR